MNKVLASAAAAALIGLMACAAEPESGANGTCSLSCSQPRVGSSTYKVRQLSQPTSAQACLAQFTDKQLAPANGPVQVRYQIFEVEPKMFPTDPASDGNQGPLPPSGRDDDDEHGDRPYVEEEPRAGIGFEPVLSGLLDVGKTNDEFKSGADTVSSFKFAGVVTSSSEWCSDSCGVITYEFWPDCKQGDTHTIQAGIAVSGGVPADSYSFTFSN